MSENENRVKYSDVAGMEKMINEVFAKAPQLRLFGIRPEHYQVYLSLDQDPTISIYGGHIVRISIKWPDAMIGLGLVIKDIMHTMTKNWAYLRKPMELVPYVWVKETDEWKKQSIKKYEGDPNRLFGILPRRRLKIETRVVTKLIDVQTGEYVESEKIVSENDIDNRMWIDLSRKVQMIEKASMIDEVKEEEVKNG